MPPSPAPASQSAIQCVDVRKTYKTGEVETPVLRGVSLDIRAGELSVILGMSGSGKTTLLNIISGIDTPTSGQVLFQGKDLARLGPRGLTRHRRRYVGFVFQLYNLAPTLTALENVETATQIAKNPMDPAKALEMVGLGDRMRHFPSQLSGGQQQRVSIARALAKNPEIVFCDEPTGALDAETGRMVLDLLVTLNAEQGRTIVIVTHATPIAQLAHRIFHLTAEGARTEVNSSRIRATDISW